jgi:hypothetical protein
MPVFVTEYPQFFTASIKGWYKLLEHDKYKDIIVNSPQFSVVFNKIKNPERLCGDCMASAPTGLSTIKFANCLALKVPGCPQCSFSQEKQTKGSLGRSISKKI